MAPNVLTLEPDQAREYCLNLVRHHKQFAVEIDPTLKGMKDVCVVHREAILHPEEAAERGYTLLRQRATDRDTACQYVHNLINAELTFQVNPEYQQGTGREEWLILTKTRHRKEAY